MPPADDGAPVTEPAPHLTGPDPALTATAATPITLPTEPGPGGTGAAIAAAAREAGRATRPPTRARRLLVTPVATFAVLAGVFALAAGLAWWSMPAGPLSGNDSITYLGVARNVAAGRGVTSPFGHELTGLSPTEGAVSLGQAPMTAWPPLYPLALAAGRPADVSVESVSRLLNVLAAGATAVLTALMARRMGASAVAG